MAALAASSQTTAYLQTNVGSHTDQIEDISFNAARTVALTVSNDKTARLWDLRTGDPLRVLRPPIFDGQDGQLHAAALSPSGTMAVVGGWCRSGMGGFQMNNRLQVFDTSSGNLLAQIPGFPNAISKIVFSASGKYFAASLGGPNGIYVFDSSTLRRVGQDPDYQDSCHGLAWHGDERIAASSFDGSVRLYSFGRDGLVRTHRELVGEDSKRNQPYGVAFSPNGRRLAIGFYSSPLVEVRGGHDLEFLGRPDLSGLSGTPQNKGNLMNVAWSADGGSLVAAGNYVSPSLNKLIVRRWGGQGQILDAEVGVAHESIRAISLIAGNEFGFVTGDPSWGIIRFDDLQPPQVRVVKASPLADFSQSARSFRVTEDGGTIAFGYEKGGASPALFSVKDRRLVLDPESNGVAGAEVGALFLPKLTGLPLRNWEDTDGPKLGSLKLLAKDNEISRSLAVRADESSFILGTGWRVRHFDSNGSEIWSVPTTGAWAVNLAQKDQIVVVAAGDGTIRWLEAASGRELLGFFPHADRQRWILWAPVMHKQSFPGVDVGRCASDLSRMLAATRYDRLVAINGIPVQDARKEADGISTQIISRAQPGDLLVYTFLQGGRYIERSVELQPIQHWRTTEVYYDCSPRGEDLLGWHVNRGAAQSADFFPISRFRAVYHRPDVISRVLPLRGVEAALREANRAAGRRADAAQLTQVLAHLSPPVVELHSGGLFNYAEIPVEASHMNLIYSVRQTGQEKVTRVELRLNGRLLMDDLPVPAAGRQAEVKVPLPQLYQCRLSVVARSEHAASEARHITVRRVGTLPATAMPELYLVAVGVSESQADPSMELKGAAADANSLAEMLKRRYDTSFDSFYPVTLTGPQATRAAVIDAIRSVAATARHGDLMVLSLSCHGFVDRSGFHMVMYDTGTSGPATLTDSTLLEELRAVKANVLLLLGSCQSGAVFGNSAEGHSVLSPTELTSLVNNMGGSEHGIIILSAVDNRELAYESDEGSVFMGAVLEGLAGAAAVRGEVTCRSLLDHVVKQVPITARSLKLEQTPLAVFPDEVLDMVLSVPSFSEEM